MQQGSASIMVRDCGISAMVQKEMQMLHASIIEELDEVRRRPSEIVSGSGISSPVDEQAQYFQGVPVGHGYN
jgi:hypothetical protein